MFPIIVIPPRTRAVATLVAAATGTIAAAGSRQAAPKASRGRSAETN